MKTLIYVLFLLVTIFPIQVHSQTPQKLSTMSDEEAVKFVEEIHNVLFDMLQDQTLPFSFREIVYEYFKGKGKTFHEVAATTPSPGKECAVTYYNEKEKRIEIGVYLPDIKSITEYSSIELRRVTIALVIGHELIHVRLQKEYPIILPPGLTDKEIESIKYCGEAAAYGIQILEMIRPLELANKKIMNAFPDYLKHSKKLKECGDDYKSKEWIQYIKKQYP